jgi:HlyD family secretion protein
MPWVSATETPEAPAETATAVKGAFEVGVAAVGRLRAHQIVSVVTPDVEGKVTFVATDGSLVKEGQVICQLDATEFKRELRQRELEYENARAEIKKTTADRSLEARNTDGTVVKAREELRILEESNAQLLKQAEAQLAFDEANLKRAESELARKRRQADERLIPKEQVELAEIEVRAKEFALEKGRKELALQREKNSSTEQQKKTDLDNAIFAATTAQRKTVDESAAAMRKAELMQRQRDEARDRVNWCTMRAPASGLFVLSRQWRGDGERVTRVGDSIWPRSQLAEIPDLSRMVIICRLPEREIGGVQVGAPARFRLEEDPDRSYQAQVERISSVAEEIRPWESTNLDPGTRAFTITLAVQDKKAARLLPGVTANVEIISQRLGGVVYVPKQCVFDEGDRHVVYRRLGDGRFVATPVLPGAENTRHVVIRKGLRPGQRVATTKPA